jgi:partitioning defective protein 3
MMQQQLDTTDGGRVQSPTVNKMSSREAVIIEQYGEGGRKGQPAVPRPHSPDGCEGFSERSSKISDSDVAYASQTSLEEASFMFARDQPGRQSMSEKRHATLDAKSTDTYQRSKRARQEREKTSGPEKGPIGPMLGMKKSSSLESLQTMMTEMKMESGRQANRVKTSKVVRGRGCNESFRAAVDRSYEAQDCDDQPGESLAIQILILILKFWTRNFYFIFILFSWVPSFYCSVSKMVSRGVPFYIFIL